MRRIFTLILIFSTFLANAGIITVTTSQDSVAGSLRAAFDSAQAGDTIMFDVSQIGDTIFMKAVLGFSDDIYIIGPGSDSLVIKGDGSNRILSFSGMNDYTYISGLTFTNGDGDGNVFCNGSSLIENCVFTKNDGFEGAGLKNFGTMTVRNCKFVENVNSSGAAAIKNADDLTVFGCEFIDNHSGGWGGAIWSQGTNTVLNIDSSIFRGNISDREGGAINIMNSIATITDCLFEDNEVGSNDPGAAIFNDGVSLKLNRCTFYNNKNGWGAIYNKKPLEIYSSTIAYNLTRGIFSTGSSDDVKLYYTTVVHNSMHGISGGPLRLNNTLVAFNSMGDVPGFFTSGGWNLIGDTGSTSNGTAFKGTDIVGGDSLPLDPLIGPYGDYGGFTPTIPLLCGSPAIDAGNAGSTPDQRGMPKNGSLRDIGAFEVQDGETAPYLTGADDKTVCSGYSILYTISGNDSINWYDWAGTLLASDTNQYFIGIDDRDTLIVEGYNACGSSRDTIYIDTNGVAPTASVSVLAACVGSPTTFTDASSANGSNPVYEWDFDADDNVDSSAAAGNMAYTYTASGTYTFRLTVKNDAGCQGSFLGGVHILDAPMASAGNDDNLLNDTTYSYTFAANDADSAGTGVWTVISGTGTFADSTAHNTTVTGLSIGDNVFVWTLTHGTCTDADTVVINVAFTPGMGELTTTAIDLYPNPSNGMLFVEGDVSDVLVRVYDAIGREVQSIQLTNEKVIDLSSLQKGVYYLQLIKEEASIVKRISLIK